MINISKAECCGCSACEQICPQECIIMKYDEEGFLYPDVNKKNCIQCGECIKVCPAISKRSKRLPIGVFGVSIKDRDILSDSSSGGAFSGIAEYILGLGGIVYGAAYNEAFMVEHIGIEAREELEKLRHSKYVQSRIEKIFIDIKVALEKGRFVLFTGTPCQIMGLNLYLGKEYDNLFLVDVICHGVASPQIWKMHIEEYQKKGKSKLKKIVFRDKERGWGVDIKYYHQDKRDDIIFGGYEDTYFCGFLDKLYLRPSCYQCTVRHFTSGSQITMGDFWRIQETHPDKVNPMGVSAITVNDEKGMDLFKKISEKFDYFISDIEKVTHGNFLLFYSYSEPKVRSEFFRRLVNNEEQYDVLTRKLLHRYGKVNNKFLAIGSYNLRAIVHKLQSLKKNQFRHISNSSIISMMSLPVTLTENEICNDNEYRREAVKLDYSKQFIQELNGLDSERYVMIDLIEERFDIIRFSNSYITKSEAFDSMGQEVSPENIISRISKELIQLWQEKCLEFINKLKEIFDPQRIILCEIYLSNHIGKHSDNLFFNENAFKTLMINKALTEYYHFFQDNFQGIKVIQLSANELCYTDSNFRYGCHEWYLNNEAYLDLADKIYECISE